MATNSVLPGANNPGEAVHIGINAAICKISISVSGTFSAGDVYRIGRLPQGAIPLDAVFYPGANCAATAVIKFGTSLSQELFFASATYSQAAGVYRTTRKLGSTQQISISDDARALFDYITMVPTAGTSVGHVGDLIVYYKMPGQNL